MGIKQTINFYIFILPFLYCIFVLNQLKLHFYFILWSLSSDRKFTSRYELVVTDNLISGTSKIVASSFFFIEKKGFCRVDK